MDYGALLELMRGRRSMRVFREEPVGREVLEQVVAAALWAPTASNRQDWEFTVVTSAAVKQAMGEAVRAAWDEMLLRPEVESLAEELREHAQYFTWFAGAPVVLAISMKQVDGYLQTLCGGVANDVAGQAVAGGMAAQNLMLAAQALGLGSCCLTGPLAAADRLRELLGLGRRRQLTCLVALGSPAGEAAEMPRKNITEVMRIIE